MAGTGVTAYAADVTRDDTSKFTESGTEATSGITEFYLIKDYDSENNSTNAGSPAETFEYKIKPYAVWNAGSTQTNSEGTVTTTNITKDNMPLMKCGNNEAASDRVLTVTQNVVFGDAKYEGESSDTENTNDKKIAITLPKYSTVGDYWYEVEETLDYHNEEDNEDYGNTTGVIYGTNSNTFDSAVESANAGCSRKYYIHVQVTEKNKADGYAKDLVSNVTMHKSAPNADLNNVAYNAQANTNVFYNTNNKVNAIENRYYAGDLTIKKEVTGNAGDKDEYFKVTVVFTKPEGTVINSDILYSAYNKTNTTDSGDKYQLTSYVIKGQKSEEPYTGKTVINWTSGDADSATNKQRTATCTFWVKDGSSVKFENIPYGINYTITEEKPADDNYTNNITFKDSTETEKGTVKFDNVTLNSDTDAKNSLSDDFTISAKGSISDAHDTVLIENNKVSAIDIGVLLSNAPFIALLGVAGAGAAVLVRRKRRIGE